MNDVYKKIIEMLEMVLDKKLDENEVTRDTNIFEELKVDSLGVLELVDMIEEEWGIDINQNPELIDAMEIVGELEKYVTEWIKK